MDKATMDTQLLLVRGLLLYIYARTQQLPLYDDLLYDARRDSAALRGLLGKEQASAAGTQVTRYGPAVHRRYGPRCSTCSRVHLHHDVMDLASIVGSWRMG